MRMIKRNRPDPLDCKTDVVGRLVGPVCHGLEDTCGEDVAEDPAKVDVGLRARSTPLGKRLANHSPFPATS
jgi:hypothetical protein